jgi:hypothetical protein
MIFNTEFSIALKNNFGQYCSKSFSVFEFERVICEFPSLEMKLNRSREFLFKVKCPICGEDHLYKYDCSDFVKREVVIGGCEVTGMPIFYIGKDRNVSERVNKFNEIYKKVYDIS